MVSDIRYLMDFKEIVRKRYAVKKFDGRIVPEEKIEELIEIIKLSPSSFNIQPWKIKIIKDKKTKEKLFPAAWHQEQVTSCSHLLVFCADTNIRQLIEDLENLMIKNGAEKEKIAGYIKMMQDFEANMAIEQKLSWAQRQTYLALSNALNGAVSLGLDSSPMEGFDPKSFAEILNLPSHIVPAALCAIGYAADTPREKIRFPKETIILK